jgi:penicillin-binding protein 2
VSVWYSSRNNILIVVFAALIALVSVRLYVVAGPEGEKWTKEANTNVVRTIRTDAPRGEIYDRNGILIAGNHSSYAVDFSRNEMMSNADVNDSTRALVEILNKHEETIIDEFPIPLDEDGSMSYTFDERIAEWLSDNDMPADYTAEQAFGELRSKNSIPDELSLTEAQEALIDKGITPPISVADSRIRFTQEIAKETFLKQHNVDTKDEPDAKAAYDSIRKLYEIDEQFPDLSESEVRQMVVIRSALTSLGYLRWMPTKIAADLKAETVIELEEKRHDIEGMEIVTESVRYYPEGSSASHVVGYLGKISQDKLTEYEKNGYKASDLIGLSGIENSQESILRGVDGMRRLQVNMEGEAIRELDEATEAKKGNDIALTIDMRLQKVAEESLAKALKGIRAGGIFSSEFGKYTFEERSPNAEVGAAVAVNVKTGETLTIASNPDFDPNQFAEGISQKDWDALQGDNPRDPLAPRPLYNVAALTAVQPGSTFKPMTGIVAQASGLDPYRILFDAQTVEIGDHTYKCMGSHGTVNLFTALEVSCNFYFYDAATGRDWANDGRNLGYAKDISIDKISSYANKFGLGVKTGAEIAETVSPAPTAESKLENTKTMLRIRLMGEAETIFGAKIAKDYDRLAETVGKIVSWTKENPSVATIRNRLIDLGVKKNKATDVAEECKYTYFNYAQWTTGDEFNIAIGQGENAFTPMQMARYLATMGNGGELKSMSLIKAVEGEGEVARPESESTGVKKAYVKNVVEGMRRVVENGSLSDAMEGLDVSVAGKTGTAQRSGYINPPDEVKYVKEHLQGINSSLEWKDVNKEMKRLMSEYPRLYTSKNTAVRKAVMNLSGNGFREENIDAFKDKYADFSWVMAMAPADDPEIAVVCLIVQGGPSTNASPVVREIIGQYFNLKEQDEENNLKTDFDTFFTDDKATRIISGPAVTVAANE